MIFRQSSLSNHLLHKDAMFSSLSQIYALIGLITLALFVLSWYLLFVMFRVPEDNRQYFDEPPLFYKFFGFFINIIAFYAAPFITDKTYTSYERQIVFAGVEYQFKPQHIFASKIFSGLIFSIFALTLLVLAEQNLVLALLAGIFGYLYPNFWLKEANKELKPSTFKLSVNSTFEFTLFPLY